MEMSATLIWKFFASGVFTLMFIFAVYSIFDKMWSVGSRRIFGFLSILMAIVMVSSISDTWKTHKEEWNAQHKEGKKMEAENNQSYKEYMKNHIADCKRTGDVVTNGMIERNLENPNSNTAMAMALIGMQTELGEIADIIQKKVFYGVDIDRASIIEEMGDFLFYWDLLQDQLREELCCASINDITIRDLNREKRRVRYPEGYSKEASQHRDKEKERAVFEQPKGE